MLTKTLHFEDSVTQALREMVWSDDGLSGKIERQLHPKIYQQVKKAINAMGGKWVGGKLQTHVFPIDPRPQVDGLIEAGTLTVARDGFFETPLALAERMIALAEIRPGDTVLEPSAGMGAIALALRDAGADVFCIENNDDRAACLFNLGFDGVCADFLEYKARKFRAIIQNPPFENGQDIDHVLHAFDLLEHMGVLVSIMSAGAFFRSDKKATAFREWLDEQNHTMMELPADSFKESGTGVNTCLVVIRKAGE